jgi:hypothetical protein
VTTKKKEEFIVTGEPVDDGTTAEGKPFDPANPLANVEKPFETEFFEPGLAPTNPQPEGLDDRTRFLQSDGDALTPDPHAGFKSKGASVGDEVVYCRGYKDAGRKGEDGNRILEPDYVPATIYKLDKEHKRTGHALLVYEDPQNGKQPAYAHYAEDVPGYWKHKPDEDEAEAEAK